MHHWLNTINRSVERQKRSIDGAMVRVQGLFVENEEDDVLLLIKRSVNIKFFGQHLYSEKANS